MTLARRMASRLRARLPRPVRRGDKNFRDRLWWFDVVYPITVALLLFTSLTYVVYSGQRSSRLALLAEWKLIEYALRSDDGLPPVRAGEIAVVTADSLDVARYGRAPLGRSPEASVVTYAQVIEQLAMAGVKQIYVRWDPDAHPADEVYYLPLEATLQRVKGRAAVTLVGPPNRMALLPEGIAKNARILDDATCIEPDKIVVSCAFDPEWTDWIAPVLVIDILGAASKDAPPTWLTDQLASNKPSYLLNLSPPGTLHHYRFDDVLTGRSLPTAARYAFVGADPSRAISGSLPGAVTRFVRTAYDPSDVSVQVAGTPMHVFWAQIAQMLVDGAMPRVPPPIVSILATIVLCIAIVAVMWRLGAGAAAGAFFVFVVSAPAMNGLAVRYLHTYGPLIDAFYFGGSTFIFAGFGWLSYTAFHRWRLDEQQRMHALTADLKGNFIALLSHNLNTPVAKMQGMLGLLAALPNPNPWREDVTQAERHVAQLEYAIRSVLIAAALEEGSLTERPRSVKALLEEFGKTLVPGLKRLGVRCVVRPATDGGDDLALYPLSFDVRALHAAIAALVALFALDDRVVTVNLAPHAEPDPLDPDRTRLVVTLAAGDSFLTETAAATLASTERRAVRSLAGSSFLEDVLAGLALLVVRTYHGSIELDFAKSAGVGGTVRATFTSGLSPKDPPPNPRPPHGTEFA